MTGSDRNGRDPELADIDALAAGGRARTGGARARSTAFIVAVVLCLAALGLAAAWIAAG